MIGTCGRKNKQEITRKYFELKTFISIKKATFPLNDHNVHWSTQ